jgi:hypothetical protein
MKPFKLEIFLANFWEVEQLQQELARYEGELHAKGFGACFRLRCEIKRVLRKLETDADLEPIRKSDAQR